MDSKSAFSMALICSPPMSVVVIAARKSKLQRTSKASLSASAELVTIVAWTV